MGKTFEEKLSGMAREVMDELNGPGPVTFLGRIKTEAHGKEYEVTVEFTFTAIEGPKHVTDEESSSI